MKVRMKLRITGTRNGQRWPDVGEVVDLPDREGMKLCAAGFATPEPDEPVEKAVASEPEKRRARPRKDEA